MNILKIVLLNTIFYSLFILFSLISISLFIFYFLLISLFISKRRRLKQLRRAISWYGMVIIRAFPFPFIKIHYRDFGKESVDEEGAYIFVCNHRSASDAFLMAYLPYECIQVVNIWPLRLPILGTFGRLAEYLSIREMSFEHFSQRSGELLRQGVSIITFPEGTRSRNRMLGPFHGSIFRIAQQEHCPIIPICISGNENIPPRGSLLLNPGIIKIHKLPTLPWEEFRHLPPFKIKNRLRNIIAKELAVIESKK